MIYIDTIKFPSSEDINNYYLSTYPWTIFSENGLENMTLKDVTILYGNNGSGKTTILNLIASKIEAKRNVEIFKDIQYLDKGIEIHPYDDFIQYMQLEMYKDENNKLQVPQNKELITSDDIFKTINDRKRHNNRAVLEIKEARNKHKEIIEKGYSYKSDEDYDDLIKLLEVRSLSKKKYAEKYATSKEQMKSNGETALEVFMKTFETGGLYLLDEPENCLSALYQIELIKLIQDSVRYFDCQFIISTHSPLLLSLNNAIIYDLDDRPVSIKKWTQLENVRIYYEFFKRHEYEFDNKM